jgi:hypothetical protein
MSSQKIARPTFQAVELDEIDSRLEARAAEKGIPTLVAPRAETPFADEPAPAVEAAPLAPRKPARQNSKQATPRSRMKGLRIELPDYAWIALKKLAAEQMVSLRHVIMTALRTQGISINDADMIEDGRRNRE